MNTLVDNQAKILIPGIMDEVAPITPEEEALYKDKMKTLMARWRNPSLSLHGIEGAFSEPGAKTVIPRKVIGKFSIRIVPHQTPDEVEQIVKNYLNKQWALR